MNDPKSIADHALETFWGAVAKNFPHVRSGDLDPGAAVRLADAARDAVSNWLSMNDRDQWTEIGSVITIHVDGPPREIGEKKIVAYVWDSDHQTFRTWASIRTWDWQQRHYRADNSEKPDPGVVRLEFELSARTWFWITADHQRVPVRIEHQEGSQVKYAVVSRGERRTYQIREIICNTSPVLVEIPLPSSVDQAMEIRRAMDRLVGEMNMFYHALTNG